MENRTGRDTAPLALIHSPGRRRIRNSLKSKLETSAGIPSAEVIRNWVFEDSFSEKQA